MQSKKYAEEPNIDNTLPFIKNVEKIQYKYLLSKEVTLQKDENELNPTEIMTNSQAPINALAHFLTIFQRVSSFHRIPVYLSQKIFDIIGDKSYFKQNQSTKIWNFLKKAYKICLNHHQYFIIHPYQNFKIFWDMIHFCLMIFLFFYLPLDIIFEYKWSKILRFLFNALFLFDNCLGFSTAYFHHGKLITDRKKIFQAYFYNFILDLITQSSLIYDIFFIEDETDVKRKFIKLVFLVQYRKFKRIYNTLIDRFKIDMKFGYLLDFIKLIATSICIMHWVACAWCFLGFMSGETKTWLDSQNLGNKSHYDQYLYALYWAAVTMMTVGYGDFTAQNRYETIFSIVIVVVGCGLFTYYIR